MRARILIGIPLMLLLAAPAAYPQAAAESVMLNQSSATATTKAGTALGSALNNAGGKLGNQIQTIPQSKAGAGSGVVVHKTQHASQTQQVAQNRTTQSAAAKSAHTGSMITSVQGGRVTRPTVPPAVPPKN